MPCTNSTTMHRTGLVTKINLLKGLPVGAKYDVQFNARCGDCLSCVRKNQAEWLVRCHYEHLSNACIYHLVLTYSDENQDYLEYEHIQAFHKRLRSYFYDLLGRNLNYRFVLSGEYGGSNIRPHYHVLVFGELPIDTDLIFERFSSNGFPIYSSKLLSKIWSHGYVSVQRVEDTQDLDSVASYINKGLLKKVHKNFKKRLFTKIYSENPNFNNLEEKEYKKLISSYYDKVKEKIISSKGIGFDSFLSRINDYKNNGDCIYINSVQMRIPVSWVEKLSTYPLHLKYSGFLYKSMIDSNLFDLTVSERLDYLEEKSMIAKTTQNRSLIDKMGELQFLPDDDF